MTDDGPLPSGYGREDAMVKKKPNENPKKPQPARSRQPSTSGPTSTSKAPAKPRSSPAHEAPRRKPGRPKGSGSFPSEKAEMVINLVRAGSTKLRDACISAELAYSTVRGWITRAREDPDCPKKIRDFVRRLEQASADSNILVDRMLFQAGSMNWKKLKEQEGLLEADETAEPPLDPSSLMHLLTEVLWLKVYLDPAFLVPRCPRKGCRCIWHHQRSAQQLEVTKEVARKKEQEER